MLSEARAVTALRRPQHVARSRRAPPSPAFRFPKDGFPPGGIDLLKRAFCRVGELTLQVVVKAFGKVVSVGIRGVFNRQVGGIVAQLGPEVLHLRRQAFVFLFLQQLDDREFQDERPDGQGVAHFPEFRQPDGVDNAAVSHIIEMDVEIGLQALLVAAGLIEVGVGLGFIRESSRHHVDMEIHAKIFGVTSLSRSAEPLGST